MVETIVMMVVMIVVVVVMMVVTVMMVMIMMVMVMLMTVLVMMVGAGGLDSSTDAGPYLISRQAPHGFHHSQRCNVLEVGESGTQLRVNPHSHLE